MLSVLSVLRVLQCVKCVECVESVESVAVCFDNMRLKAESFWSGPCEDKSGAV